MNGPVIVVADLPGTPTQEQVSATQAHLATSLAAVDGVEHVVPFGTSADHRTLAFQVVPSTGPAEAQTVTTVHALLDSASSIGASTGTTIGLTGQTVANIEISERLAAALPTYLLVVVGLSLLILTAVFRSVVVPLVATAGFLLSVATAFGATVMVYQWAGWARSSGSTTPDRSCPSCPSCSSVSSSAWRWTIRCSSSAGCARRGATARTPDGGAQRLHPRRQGRHGGCGDHVRGLRRLRLPI